jgi:hypothetical protein
MCLLSPGCVNLWYVSVIHSDRNNDVCLLLRVYPLWSHQTGLIVKETADYDNAFCLGFCN